MTNSIKKFVIKCIFKSVKLNLKTLKYKFKN